MRIRSDFDQIVHVTPDQHAWTPSPLPGVERVMLDRIGGERAVATSLVRYAAGAGYSPHEHGAGEEFIVLDGEIADEQGRYPPLTYVRLRASHYCRELLVLRGLITWQTEQTRTLAPQSWFRLAPGHPLRVVCLEPSLLFVKTRPHFDNET